jgi:ATP/maltotriose-dependent transcriptional regulator MalT
MVMRMLMITPGERDALQLLADGGSRTDLAVALEVSERELDWRLSTLFSRMTVRTTLDAVMECKRRGLFRRRDVTKEMSVHALSGLDRSVGTSAPTTP